MRHAHPAHALLRVAQGLLTPASTVATAAEKPITDLTVLPIEEMSMPENVSDFKDVFDAINELCETMSSNLDYNQVEVSDSDIATIQDVDDNVAEESNETVDNWSKDYVEQVELDTVVEESNDVIETNEIEYVENEQVIEDNVTEPVVEIYQPDVDIITVHETKIETHIESNTASYISSLEQVEEVVSDPETVCIQDTNSEMYYTASSEVSLVSDTTSLEKGDDKKDEKECVISGHVAAMRERYENMTRSNTPCTDLRSRSPSLDNRNVTPSPDFLR